MKKILSLFILIAVAVFALTACVQDDEVANGDVATTEDTSSTIDAEDTGVAEGTEVAEPAEFAEPVGFAEDNTRGPITILGNADFTSENGVVGGTGTADDPYVIAAWEIVVPSGESYGVRIENVTAQFALRGLIIQNATDMNGAGIRIGFAAGGAIEGCSIANSMHGIDIVSSTDISIDSCVLYVSGRGLRVVGIANTNLYNNNPIYYFYGLDGETITGLQGGHLTVAGSRNVTISNNEVVNGDGLLLAFVEDSTVTLNLVHRTANVITDHGIHLYESHNNQLTSNVVKNNRLAGIQLTLSTGNSILDNFTLVNDSGIRVLASDDNVIRGNEVYASVSGITLLGGASGNSVIGNTIRDDQQHMTQGIALEAAFSNTIDRNLIFGAEFGIMFEAQASGNTATDNTVTSGGYGLYMSGTNNTIERNLLTQFSRGILFRETFGSSITQGNTFRTWTPRGTGSRRTSS